MYPTLGCSVSLVSLTSTLKNELRPNKPFSCLLYRHVLKIPFLWWESANLQTHFKQVREVPYRHNLVTDSLLRSLHFSLMTTSTPLQNFLKKMFSQETLGTPKGFMSLLMLSEQSELLGGPHSTLRVLFVVAFWDREIKMDLSYLFK